MIIIFSKRHCQGLSTPNAEQNFNVKWTTEKMIIREAYKSPGICRHIGTLCSSFSSSSNWSLILDVYITHLFKIQQLADSRDFFFFFKELYSQIFAQKVKVVRKVQMTPWCPGASVSLASRTSAMARPASASVMAAVTPCVLKDSGWIREELPVGVTGEVEAGCIEGGVPRASW